VTLEEFNPMIFGAVALYRRVANLSTGIKLSLERKFLIAEDPVEVEGRVL
jgi:hypothetical protein